MLLFAEEDPQDLPDPLLYLLFGLFQHAQHLLQAPAHLSRLRLASVPISVARCAPLFYTLFPNDDKIRTPDEVQIS